MRWFFLLAALTLLASTPVQAKHWQPQQAVIVTADAHATAAGERMLAQGGNAFDAAAAIALTLGVAEPGSSGIGGGGFFVFCQAADRHNCHMIDARESAPQLAGNGEIYQQQSSVDGPQSAGTPGLLAGIDLLLQSKGSLSRKKIAQPAIELAEKGYRANARLQRMLQWRGSALNDEGKRIFLPEDGWIRQPQLANTLKRYVHFGVDDFYRGETAQRLVKDMKRDGGLIRLQDLANYRPLLRQPIHINWQGQHLVTANLPSSGGMVLAEVLGMLQQDKLNQLPAIERKVLLIEAMRRAYRDRNQYLGDSDFISIPEDYLNEARLQKLRQSIKPNKATPSETLHGVAEPSGAGEDTTHFSVIDQQGNMVVATLSINYGFGSAYVSPATGIVLNDEMDDFATQPGKANAYGLVQGKANAVAPGKRMLSSMTPTIIFADHRLALLGTPGGSRIISMVLLSAINMMTQQGISASWVQQPRYHHQFLPDVVQYEAGAFSDQEIKILQTRGYQLKKISDYGNMQAIFCQRDDGQCIGVSDRRGEGTVAIYPQKNPKQ